MNQSSDQQIQLKNFNTAYGGRFKYNQQYFDFFGKHVYCTKLYVSPYPELQIILLQNFPQEAPIFKVLPRMNAPSIQGDGVIADPYLFNWNSSSNLTDATRIILYKLEGSNGNSKQKSNTSINDNEVSAISKTIMQSLKGKTIEDLLFVYYNLEQYSFNFLLKERSENEKLLKEVNDLYLQLQSRQTDFSAYQKEIEESERAIDMLQKQKGQYDKKYQKEEIIGKLEKYIEEKFYLPKSQLITDFHNKKIAFDEYKAKFKELAMNFYYYTIIKEKLKLAN